MSWVHFEVWMKQIWCRWDHLWLIYTYWYTHHNLWSKGYVDTWPAYPICGPVLQTTATKMWANNCIERLCFILCVFLWFPFTGILFHCESGLWTHGLPKMEWKTGVPWTEPWPQLHLVFDLNNRCIKFVFLTYFL